MVLLIVITKKKPYAITMKSILADIMMETFIVIIVILLLDSIPFVKVTSVVLSIGGVTIAIKTISTTMSIIWTGIRKRTNLEEEEIRRGGGRSDMEDEITTKTLSMLRITLPSTPRRYSMMEVTVHPRRRKIV